jgi:LPXTG-motif cell wall-anchored protein
MIFAISNASAAIGVSPAKYELNYEPNLKQILTFNFFGDGDVPMEIYVEGDLEKYAELSTKHLDGPGVVNVLLKLPPSPDELNPGNNRLLVGARQTAPAGVSAIGTAGEMRAVINLKVPFPGRYAILEFTTADAKAGEPIPMTFKIFSVGRESVLTESRVEIYDLSDRKIDSINLGNFIVHPSEIKDLSGFLNSSKYKPAKYKTKGIVDFQEGKAEIESGFRLGELFVNISNYTTEFQRNLINKFDVDVESFWNDPLENVYVAGMILEYNITFKTPSTTLNGFQRQTLTGYLDTTSIPKEADNFKANLTVYYAGRSTEILGKLHFKQEISALIYIIAALIVLVLVLGWLVFRRRKKNETKSKGKV